jgi:MoaA/NifB/PqqE/SkfB family radical SAM enzyme
VLDRLGEAMRGGVAGCAAGRAFFNVDHRGRVSKCVEFRAPADRLGTIGEDSLPAVRARLGAAAGANDCRACFYASRAEVETLYTMRGLLHGLRTLVLS